MKALTVRQPWAECIARGDKLVENRTRGLSYRGPLAIHAAQAEADDGWRSPLVRDVLGDTRGIDLVHGAVLAVADLIDVHLAGPWPDGCGPLCGVWGESGAHHLVLDQVRVLATPVPARGQLGLWNIDDEVIRRALPTRVPALRPGLV